MSDLELLRDYIGDTEEPYTYSDEVLETYLEVDTYPECSAIRVFRKEMSSIGKGVAGIKSMSIAGESHTYNSTSEQLAYYREQIKQYESLCSRKTSGGTSLFLRGKRPSVAGITPEE